MPKNFIVFLIIFQAVLSAVYALALEVLIVFFPALRPYRLALNWAAAALSLTPLALLTLTHNYDVRVFNWLTIFSVVLLVEIFYFLFASLPAFFLFLGSLLSLPQTGALALAGSLIFSLYGIINARIIRQKELTLALPNLPAWWKGKTAMLATDLHLGQILKKGFAEKIVRLINAQSPEIVFIPGDFYDGVHTDFNALAEVFKQVRAPLGIYFCSGNHEMFAGYEKCESALRKAGINILENQKVEIQGMQIAGVAYSKEKVENLPQILGALNLQANRPSILLKHVPLQIAEAAEAGISLQLSGHSHQGQIWPGRHITKKYFSGFDYGLKKFGQMLVYTSSGCGTWGPPMRTFTQPEIVKLTFI